METLSVRLTGSSSIRPGQTIIFLEGGGDEKFGGKRLQVLKRQNKLFASTICVKKCLQRSQISY